VSGSPLSPLYRTHSRHLVNIFWMDERQRIISSCCSPTYFFLENRRSPLDCCCVYLILKHSSLMRNNVSLSADVAIGAPFAGKDQRGKVLIYNGNKNGLNTKPSQILQGVWASQAVPSGFGFTLRGDSDIDKNDYPGKFFFLFT